jgi:hypothetical protein
MRPLQDPPTIVCARARSPTKSCRLFDRLSGFAPWRASSVALKKHCCRKASHCRQKCRIVRSIPSHEMNFGHKSASFHVDVRLASCSSRWAGQDVQVRDRSTRVRAPNICDDGSQPNGSIYMASRAFRKQAISAPELASGHPCSPAWRCRHLRLRLVCASCIRRECGRRWRGSRNRTIVDRGMVDAPQARLLGRVWAAVVASAAGGYFSSSKCERSCSAGSGSSTGLAQPGRPLGSRFGVDATTPVSRCRSRSVSGLALLSIEHAPRFAQAKPLARSNGLRLLNTRRSLSVVFLRALFGL